MTAALLDRLTHRCHIFEMNGESYRFRESIKGRQEDQGPRRQDLVTREDGVNPKDELSSLRRPSRRPILEPRWVRFRRRCGSISTRRLPTQSRGNFSVHCLMPRLSSHSAASIITATMVSVSAGVAGRTAMGVGVGMATAF